MRVIESYKMFDPTRLDKGLPPEREGNYIFLLRHGVKLPENMIHSQPTFTALTYEGKEYEVLYTGVTSKTLYERVFKTHLFGNNAGNSTLRKSLGCLWGYPFIYRDKNPNPAKTSKTKFSDEDEKSITQWMTQNLLVLVVPNSNFDNDETELIETFNPPLNLDKNSNEINLSYRMQLKKLRTPKVEIQVIKNSQNTTMNKSKIEKINQVLADFFEENKGVERIPALDMMDYFVNAGIFKKNYTRPGLPIRKLLRELDDSNELHLIPYVVVERKAKNRYWYFEPLKQ